MKLMKQAGTKHNSSKSGIIVEGMNDVAVRFSKCCSQVREMKLWDLSPEEEVFLYTEPIV